MLHFSSRLFFILCRIIGRSINLQRFLLKTLSEFVKSLNIRKLLASFDASIFRLYDILDASPFVVAIRNSLICMFAIILCGFVGVVVRSADAQLGIIARFPEWTFFICFIERICSAAYAPLGILLSIAISYYFLRELDSKNRAEIWSGVILSSIVYIIFTGFGGIPGANVIFNPQNPVVSYISGFSSALMLHFLTKKYFSPKVRYYDNIDPIWRNILTYVPGCFLTGFCALILELGVELLRHGESLSNAVSSAIATFPSRFDFMHGHGGVFFVLYHQLLTFLGVYSRDVSESVYRELILVFQSADDFVEQKLILHTSLFILSNCVCVLALAFSYSMFSSSKRNREIAVVGLIPALFGIYEPIIYGLVIILNPMLLLPFFLLPFVNYICFEELINPSLFTCLQVSDISMVFPVTLMTKDLSCVGITLLALLIDLNILYPYIRLCDQNDRRYIEKHTKQIIEVMHQYETAGKDFRLRDLHGGDLRVAITLMTALHEDLATKRHLNMYFQPQVDGENHCIGAEALIRWNNPYFGFIYPPLIIALAEQGDFLEDLEAFIFDASARELSEMQKNGHEGKISINITGKSLLRENLVDMIDSSVAVHNISRDHFFVELTEQDAISTSKTAIENLQKLKDRGYHLLIDDFGMGHTSIRYLQYDIFDTIKLDGSITQHISEDQEEKNRVIISNITDLSTKFHLSVVAEYVETREQKEKLSLLGVDYFQGYYISKPLAADDYNHFLDSWNSSGIISA